MQYRAIHKAKALFLPHREAASCKCGLSTSENQGRPETLPLPFPITIPARVTRRGREGGIKNGEKMEGGWQKGPAALGALSWKGQFPGKVSLEQEGEGGAWV